METKDLMKSVQDLVEESDIKVQENNQKDSYKPFDLIQYNIDKYNKSKQKSDVGNCDYCNNSGLIAFKDSNGQFALRQCKCYKTRKCREKLKNLGLLDFVLSLKGKFENLPEKEEWERVVKSQLKDYIENNNGKSWLSILGKSGSGKTTKGTIIFSELIKQYPYSTFDYFTWDTRWKELIFSKDKEILLEQLQEVDILFLDDFMRHLNLQVNDMEKEVAKAVIDYRLINNKQTIITSELYMDELVRIDEAIGSRIFQKCNQTRFTIQIKRDPKRNYRLKDTGTII